jgi:hypothetical protein
MSRVSGVALDGVEGLPEGSVEMAWTAVVPADNATATA